MLLGMYATVVYATMVCYYGIYVVFRGRDNQCLLLLQRISNDKTNTYTFYGMCKILEERNIIGSHDSDSQLGMTPVVSGGRMLMYWLGRRLVPNGLPTGSKAEMRRWI